MTEQLLTKTDVWDQNRLIDFVAEALEAQPGEFEVSENLIELGLNSIALMRLCGRLQNDGIDVSFSSLAEAGSITGWQRVISQAITEQANEHSQLPLPTDDAQEKHETFPLTHVQRAYWLGRNQQFELGGVAAHGYLELETEAVSPHALETALNKVIQDNPMLRAIITEDGQQQVLEHVESYCIITSDYSASEHDQAQHQRLETRHHMRQQVKPTDQWPLFDIALSHMPDDIWVIHISFDILIFDLKSLEIWIDQWWQLYRDPCQPLPPAGTDFHRHIAYLNAQENTSDHQTAQAYWDARLEDFPLGPELPLLTPCADIEVPHFQRLQVRLPQKIWQKVQNQAHRHGLTASAVLITVYGRLLSLWSTQPRFCLTTTLFSRDHTGADMAQTIGDFTSLLLLEVDCTLANNIAGLAKAVQTQLWRDLDHHQVSGIEVLAKLAARENSPGRALAPYVFTSALGTGRSYLDAFAQFGRVVDAAVQTPQVLIDHQALEENGELVLNWDYVAQAFSKEQIDYMAQLQLNWLSALAQGDAWKNPALFARTTKDWQRKEQNATDRQPSKSYSYLHQPFEDIAQSALESIAIVHSDRSISYRALDNAANALATQLQQYQVQADELVAVFMPKGWQQIVAVIGILKSGAAYLPIDPNLPKARIAQVLEQAEAKIIITCSGQPLNKTLKQVVITESLLDSACDKPNCQAKTHDLAYVIFTSGSTGTPKGVMIEHRSALNTVQDICERNHLNTQDHCLMVSALSFDLSVQDIFGTLSVGATLVIPNSASTPDPTDWHTLINTQQVTVWNSVPALFQLYIDFLEDNHLLSTLATLKHVFLSGDWLSPSLCCKLKAHAPNCKLVAMGGATEASIWSNEYVVNEIDPRWRSIPYGSALSNQTMQVLDHHLNPRPDNVPGEIFIGGVGLARGYWRDNAKTMGAFIHHPLTGERLYRTGDWGRWHAEGWIEFLGRTDTQVKLNGLRLELGEVESLMSQHPGVDTVCALIINDGTRGDSLVAFARRSSPQLTTADIQNWLSNYLPTAFIPRLILFKEALPLTANGKIDRQALAALARSNLNQQTYNHRTASPDEQKILALWSQLLERKIEDPESNFFTIGGNSLLATRLATLLSGLADEHVSAVKIFEFPTAVGQSCLLTSATVDTSAKLASLENNTVNRRERQQRLRRQRKSRRP